MAETETPIGEQDAIFVVTWHDFVANEWVEVVNGPFDASEEALRAHAKRGEDEGSFKMNFIRVTHSIGSEDINIGLAYSRTVDDFLNNPASPWFDEDEVTPTCDLCGEPEDQDPTNGREYNWNGETGNHLSCEREAAYAKSVTDVWNANRDS